MKKVSDLIAEAQVLLREAPQAAMTLLLEERGGREVPDAYEIILANATLATGDPESAAAHLQKALEKKPESAPLRRLYGEMLLDIGHFTQAGEQLHLALGTGAPLEKFPLPLKLAMQDYLRLTQPNAPETAAMDKRVVTEYGLLDGGNRLLYIYSPKVACTILKATIIMNGPRREEYLASGKTIHEFVGRIRDELALLDALAAPDIFRFALVRDPATRIVSAYLNKFVGGPAVELKSITRKKKIAVTTGQRLAGVTPNPERGITFEEFVHFLAQAHDLEMDPHWMPQSRIIGNDMSIYHHVGRFEALSETVEILHQRHGFVLEADSSVHLGGQTNHITKYSAEVNGKRIFKALPAELRRLGGIYPPAEAFLPPALRDVINKRYAVDVQLHASAFTSRA